MSIKNKIHLTCSVLLLFVAPLTAAAIDFTFNVPVNIQNQNGNVVDGEVRCTVESDADKNLRVGEGVQFFSLDSLGNFQGTLTVAFDADADEEPALGRFYTCVLRVKDNNGSPMAESDAPGNYTVTGGF
jgi:hypothetical protein